MWRGKKANSQERKEAMSQALVGRAGKKGRDPGLGIGQGRGGMGEGCGVA